MGQLLVPRPLPGKLPEKLRLRIKMIASGQMLLNMQKATFMSDKLSPISHGDGSIVGEGGQIFKIILVVSAFINSVCSFIY